MRTDEERLRDVVDAVANIERYTSEGRAPFDDDELVQVWVVHHLEVVGEACAGVSQSCRDALPSVPWSNIVGMRNILIHHYFGISLERVWAAVEQARALAREVAKYLESLASRES